MLSRNERKLFLTMFKIFMSTGAEDQHGNSWNHPVDYTQAAKVAGISESTANRPVYDWVTMGWLSDQPPPIVRNSGLSFTTGGNNFYFTDSGKNKGRKLLEAEKTPRNWWLTFNSWWQHNIFATLAMIVIIAIPIIRGLIAFYFDLFT